MPGAINRAAAPPTRGTGADALARPLFRQRDFCMLWWGQLVSLTGERCTYLALIALIAEHTHGLRGARSAWLLSLLANTMLAPVLLFAPFVGAWIDRQNLRRIVVGADVMRAATVMLIPVAYQLGGRIAPVFGLLFVLFTCGVFFLPAKSSLTPEIVPGPQLMAANTWLTLAGIVATALGALGGGWFVDHWGWGRALQVNGITYLASAAAMTAIRYVPHARTAPAALGGLHDYVLQLRDGWTAILDTAAVSGALVALAVLWWCGGFAHVAGNLHVQQAAGAPGMERLGALFAVLGAGGGLGAWWVNVHGRRLPRTRLLAAAVMLAGAGIAGLGATSLYTVFVAAAFALGLATAPILLVVETALQQCTAAGARGRVFAARDFAMRLTLLVSVSAAAWLSRVCGAQRALLLCGALVLGLGLVLWALARREASQARSGH